MAFPHFQRESVLSLPADQIILHRGYSQRFGVKNPPEGCEPSGGFACEHNMTITREQILASLHADWGTFVEGFQRLSPEAQAMYLQQQGYARFADLLAYVIAWWQEGLAAVPAMLSNPAYTSPDHDVDQFNAQAVDRLHDLNESAISAIFSDLRQQWIELVNGLPAEAFQTEKIAWRLHIEIIGHYAEHNLA
jgi:hypothetical protein